MSRRFGPPQYSEELPLHSMLQSESPLVAMTPPFEIALPQSIVTTQSAENPQTRKEKQTALSSVLNSSVDIARSRACRRAQTDRKCSRASCCGHAIRECSAICALTVTMRVSTEARTPVQETNLRDLRITSLIKPATRTRIGGRA